MPKVENSEIGKVKRLVISVVSATKAVPWALESAGAQGGVLAGSLGVAVVDSGGDAQGVEAVLKCLAGCCNTAHAVEMPFTCW